MSQIVKNITSKPFRKSFRVIHKETLQWFPGHMGKGLKQMQQKLRSVDCIIEVHDARIPLSGRNIDFKYKISGIKPHILVLNKKDLIERKTQSLIKSKLSEENINVLYTNCKDQRCDGVKKLIPLAVDLITNSNRFNRAEQREYSIMVIGVPNVGKSSLVNILRNKNLHKPGATQVGAIPGITRSVLTRIKISEDPLVYLLDTPGILTPSVRDTESGFKLALCACLQDHLVGEDIIADYLLYWMNKQNKFQYVKFMGLDEPLDEISMVLANYAFKNNKIKMIKSYDGRLVQKPDLTLAALQMIRAFRNGDFGKICLDENLL